MIPITRYVHVNSAKQKAALVGMNIKTIEDLVKAIRVECAIVNLPVLPNHAALLRRHILSFLSTYLEGAFLSISSLLRDDIVSVGGTFPLQWILFKRLSEEECSPDENEFTSPVWLQCPLTKQLFRDPVTTPDGNIYERESIVALLRQTQVDPLSKTALSPSSLASNPEMKLRCEAFRQRYTKL